MSEKQYLKALNDEIQKLNGIIDIRILSGVDYKREAYRHKRLLSKLRREEAHKLFQRSFKLWMPWAPRWH